jgi:rfaE bifunctional protein kinase chain/domain
LKTFDIKEIAGTKVLVIGDLMIDTHYWGLVSRMSPEAPVPVLAVDRIEQRPGGAGNVVNNLQALKAKTFVASVIGQDARAGFLCKMLEEEGADTAAILRDEHRVTTEKIRMINGTKHMLRCDLETTDVISQSKELHLLNEIREIMHREVPAVIILQDYNKGVLSQAVIKEVIALAASLHIPVAVDPKARNFFEYKGVTLFKPNLKEVKDALAMDIDAENMDELNAAASKLFQRLQCRYLLITLSEHGAFYAENGGTSGKIKAHPRNILDVSGAGDTVISVAALCLAKSMPLHEIAFYANLGGGLVCEHAGVVSLELDTLAAYAAL